MATLDIQEWPVRQFYFEPTPKVGPGTWPTWLPGKNTRTLREPAEIGVLEDDFPLKNDNKHSLDGISMYIPILL